MDGAGMKISLLVVAVVRQPRRVMIVDSSTSSGKSQLLRTDCRRRGSVKRSRHLDTLTAAVGGRKPQQPMPGETEFFFFFREKYKF